MSNVNERLLRAIKAAKEKGDVPRDLSGANAEEEETSPLDIALEEFAEALSGGDSSAIKETLKSAIEIARDSK